MGKYIRHVVYYITSWMVRSLSLFLNKLIFRNNGSVGDGVIKHSLHFENLELFVTANVTTEKIE